MCLRLYLAKTTPGVQKEVTGTWYVLVAWEIFFRFLISCLLLLLLHFPTTDPTTTSFSPISIHYHVTLSPHLFTRIKNLTRAVSVKEREAKMASRPESEHAGSTTTPQPPQLSQSNYGSVSTSQRARPGQRYSTAPPSSRQSRASTIGAGAGTGTGTRQGSLRNSQSAQFQPYFQDDTESISSRSSYSTYSSSTSSLNNFGPHEGKHHSCSADEQQMTSTQLFWTYVALAPILLSILALFAGLLQLLPSSTDSGVIVHWGKDFLLFAFCSLHLSFLSEEKKQTKSKSCVCFCRDNMFALVLFTDHISA